jgi:hypothetical protein
MPSPRPSHHATDAAGADPTRKPSPLDFAHTLSFRKSECVLWFSYSRVIRRYASLGDKGKASIAAQFYKNLNKKIFYLDSL